LTLTRTRYAALFRAPHTAALHRAVKRARHASPYVAAERLWFARLGGVKGRPDCSKWWLTLTLTLTLTITLPLPPLPDPNPNQVAGRAALLRDARAHAHRGGGGAVVRSSPGTTSHETTTTSRPHL
jgi:hypothetical protein